ncbi:MAG TPA: hypothetical protein PKW50_10005, partial [Syntrophomonas sp.]|nr:hypothetical protein [Syntrophomonas sp.]
ITIIRNNTRMAGRHPEKNELVCVAMVTFSIEKSRKRNDHPVTEDNAKLSALSSSRRTRMNFSIVFYY